MLILAQFLSDQCVIVFTCVVSVSSWAILQWSLYFLLCSLYICFTLAKLLTPLRTYNAPWFYKFFSDLAVLCVSILMLGDYFCFPSFPSSPRKPCFWCVTEVGSSLMILAQFRTDSSLLFDSHVVFQLLRSLNFFGDDGKFCAGIIAFPTAFFWHLLFYATSLNCALIDMCCFSFFFLKVVLWRLNNSAVIFYFLQHFFLHFL